MEVNTDEELIRRLASPGVRLTGQFLDTMIAFGPLIAVAIFVAITELPESAYLGLFYIGGIFAFLYTLFADGLQGGQSWGKRVMGVAVVDVRTNLQCSFAQSLGRNACLCILGIADWLWIFGRLHQRLGDRLVHTIVVKVPKT